MPSLAVKTDRHYTWADYQTFPEGERWEIIDGVAYSMSPAPLPEHQNLGIELAAQVRSQLRGKPCVVFIAPFDVRFQRGDRADRADRADRIVQPDLLVVCDRSKITPRGIVGAPDWIVEILSPAAAGHDQITKRALYEEEAVREYWIVHPTDRILTVYRRSASGAFAAPEIRETTGRLAATAVPGIEIDWGLWEPLDPAET